VGAAGPFETVGAAGPFETAGAAGPLETEGAAGPFDVAGVISPFCADGCGAPGTVPGAAFDASCIANATAGSRGVGTCESGGVGMGAARASVPGSLDPLAGGEAGPRPPA
jgi:hypothetical protein